MSNNSCLNSFLKTTYSSSFNHKEVTFYENKSGSNKYFNSKEKPTKRKLERSIRLNRVPANEQVKMN